MHSTCETYSLSSISDGTMDEHFLGFDFSTQQVKAVLINSQHEVLLEEHILFDSDLPEFRTEGGVLRNDDGVTVSAPTLMFVKALDMLMDKLKGAGANFGSIAAVSGCGQQHGSVYWCNGASEKLSHLDPQKFIHEQLSSECFSVENSPVWLDSSTTKYCKLLEEQLGGPEKLSKLTGSRAFERFTGNQIAKIFHEQTNAYRDTERISLVSSFACSLFLGSYAPIDLADGSGMNLLDISTRKWDQTCLEVCGGPTLKDKLGPTCVPTTTVVGTICDYFVHRFGFNPRCKVVAFTGDNPASLAGVRLSRGDMALSLGTSDNSVLWLDKPITSTISNVFVNPVDSNAYMGICCFSNGSLAREKIKNLHCNGTWESFSEVLSRTPKGNSGNIGLYFFTPEILPPLVGSFCFPNAKENKDSHLTSFKCPDTEVRALVEGQFLARRYYAERSGLTNVNRIIATGGASCNKDILQVAADVFNAEVYTSDRVNSGCFGGALIAKCGHDGTAFGISSGQAKDLALACSPSDDASEIYDPMLKRFGGILESLVKDFGRRN